MSFITPKEVIEEGDTIILYINPNVMYAIEVLPTIKSKKEEIIQNIVQTMYGALKVMSLVGKKYGTKVSLSKGWAFVLHPTPELWTLTLPHRTQIIYSLDASVIVHQLEIKPGNIVVEAGTGSGSLSHYFIRRLHPAGHLYTFDFHSARVEIANTEFKKHGLSDYVTIAQRDICTDGFPDNIHGKVDALFLDLPHPWEAVPHVIPTLKESGGRFGSFSPCIEQVKRTCEQLDSHGFEEVTTIECLQKEYQVQQRSVSRLDLSDCGKLTKDNVLKYTCAIPPVTMPGHTGYLTFASLPPLWARRKKSGGN